MTSIGGPVGELLASTLLKGQRTFIPFRGCKDLMLARTAFGLDLVVGLLEDTIHVRCSDCKTDLLVRRDERKRKGSGGTIYCTYCKRAHILYLLKEGSVLQALMSRVKANELGICCTRHL